MRLPILLLLTLLTTAANAIDIDEPAPDFTLKSLAGDNLRLEEQRGDVLLINFWASWCGPCRQEMPILDKIHKRYEKAGFQVLGVNVEKDVKKARRIAVDAGLKFPLLSDDRQSVSEDYGVDSMPYTVLVDRSGQVRYVHQGYKPGDEEHYVNRLRALLRE